MTSTKAEAIYDLGVINGIILSAKLSDDVESKALGVLGHILEYVSKKRV